MSDDGLKKKKKKKKGKELATSKSLDLKPPKMKDQKRDVSGTDGKTKEVAAAPKETKGMMTVEKDDYIIVQVGKKNKLCFAHSPKRNTAYVEDTMELDEPVTVEYDANTLIANLGKKPAPGKVFGVDIRPRHGEIETQIGKIQDYRNASEAELKALRSGIKKSVAIVEELGLEKIFPFGRVELHGPRGKSNGTYQVSFKSGTAVDSLKLHPLVLEDPQLNRYNLLHEFGTAIWYRLVNEKYRAEWLALYNTLNKVAKAKKTDMAQMFDSLVSSQLSVREYQSDLQEEELALFKDALAYLKKVHKMTPEDTNILLNQNSVVLGEIWPTQASVANHSSITALMGATAATSVQKMFAEAFAQDQTGKQIPKSAKKLLDKTLKAARSE